MERRKRVDALTLAILAPTLTARPSGSADWALDGTGIDAPERGQRKEKIVELDGHEEDAGKPLPTRTKGEPQPRAIGKGAKGPTDAAWGNRSGDNGGRVAFWGYDVEALIRVPAVGRTGPARDEPSLVEHLVVLPAATDIVEPCLRMIDSLAERGAQISQLVVDRHYSYKAYDRWLVELRRRGIHQIADLREDDAGFRDWDGMRIAASHPHCPATPDGLGELKRPGSTASKEEMSDFAEKIEKREAYAMQFVNRPDVDGRSKIRCPARNGTIGCPLVEGTVAAAAVHSLEVVTTPPSPEERPKVCTQDTVTLRANSLAQKRAMKLAQPDYWGSKNWYKNFARRTRIEGWFGVLKNGNATGLRKDSHQFRGLPWVTIVLALAAAVTNTRLLRTWHEETGLGDPNHPLLKPDQPFHGFTQLTAEEAAQIDKQCAPRYASGPGGAADRLERRQRAS